MVRPVYYDKFPYSFVNIARRSVLVQTPRAFIYVCRSSAVKSTARDWRNRSTNGLVIECHTEVGDTYIVSEFGKYI